jgi:hypothetical protein
MDSEPIHHLTCVLCGRPVLLEIAKADEHGQAVHQECYELRLFGGQSPWPEAYCKAIWELENALVAGCIFEARAEIANRLVELDNLPGLHGEERLAISEALQCLRSLEHEDQRYRAIEIGKAAWLKLRSISTSFATQPADRP